MPLVFADALLDHIRRGWLRVRAAGDAMRASLGADAGARTLLLPRAVCARLALQLELFEMVLRRLLFLEAARLGPLAVPALRTAAPAAAPAVMPPGCRAPGRRVPAFCLTECNGARKAGSSTAPARPSPSVPGLPKAPQNDLMPAGRLLKRLAALGGVLTRPAAAIRAMRRQIAAKALFVLFPSLPPETRAGSVSEDDRALLDTLHINALQAVRLINTS